MGINFYCYVDIDKDLIFENISKNNLYLEEYLENHKIHIGRRTNGIFLYNKNYWKYYSNDLESIKKFLEGKYLFCENGEKSSFQDMMSYTESFEFSEHSYFC